VPAKNPVLLRQGPISGEVHAIRRYTRKRINGREVINAIEKEVVTLDFNAVMLQRLMGDDTGLLPLLGEAVESSELSDADKARLDLLGERLLEAVVQVNEAVERDRARDAEEA
jgi:hypothetical protein